MQKNFDDVPLSLGRHELPCTVSGHVVIEDGDITEIVIDANPTEITASHWSLDPVERSIWAGMYDVLAAMFDAEIISTADYEAPVGPSMRERL